MVGDAISDMKASAEVGVQCAVALWDSYALEEILLMNPPLKFFSVEEFSKWTKEIVLRDKISNNKTQIASNIPII